MTKITFYFVLILSTNTIQCMENNGTIGTIDKLMIERKAQKKGIAALEQKINKHEFTFNNSLPIPFSMIYAIPKNENSSLSHMLESDRKDISKSDNALNNQPNKSLIDHCTSWHLTKEIQKWYKLEKLPDVVILQADFYDKEALMAVIKTLKK